MILSASERERYSRHLILEGFGEERQLLLKKATVLLLGCGGLSHPAVQYLCASGIGRLIVCDGDQVSMSNLHRQILFNEMQIGMNKAEALAQSATKINPHVIIDVVPEYLGADNILDWLPKADVILDGSDNFSSRYLLNDACILANKPLVSASIYKFQLQISVFNYRGGPSLRCLFPEAPDPGEMPACGDVGVLSVVPGIAGVWQAMECIKIICSIGKVLNGILRTVDLLELNFQDFYFEKNLANFNINGLKSDSYSCLPSNKQMGYREWISKNLEDFFLIDVRNPDEYQSLNIGGLNVPLPQLEQRWREIEQNKKNRILIIHCQSGRRARQGANILESHGLPSIVLLDIPWDSL